MIRYYDAKTGWANVEGTIEEALGELHSDGPTIIKADRKWKHLRVIKGNCCGDDFVLVAPATTP